MKKNKSLLLGVLLAGIVLVGSATAFQFGMMGHPSTNSTAQTQIQQAIANNDYTAFVNARNQYFPQGRTITQDQFAKMANAYQTHQQLENAVSSGNYNEWKTLLEQNSSAREQGLLKVITAENFHLLKDLQDARAMHDFAKVKEIMTQLGFPSPPGKGIRMGKNFAPGQMMHARSSPHLAGIAAN